MTIKLEKILIQEKSQLKGMLLDYLREIDNSKVVITIKGEEVDYPYIDLYWEEASRIPLNVIFNNEIVGFVLINDWIIFKDFKAEKSIAEFYIKPAYRRKEIGKRIAFEIFEKFRGKWEIRQSSSNLIAIKFWRNIIDEFTRGNFKEVKKGEELIQLFES